jgi:hypothetical protein
MGRTALLESEGAERPSNIRVPGAGALAVTEELLTDGCRTVRAGREVSSLSSLDGFQSEIDPGPVPGQVSSLDEFLCAGRTTEQRKQQYDTKRFHFHGTLREFLQSPISSLL